MKNAFAVGAGLLVAALNVQAVGVNLGGFDASVGQVAIPKAASAQTIAARAVASPSQTVFGGFQLAQAATVMVLVRGNSLGTLNVTSNFLDAPRVRLYNAAGADLIFDDLGVAGANQCLSSVAAQAPVVAYYQNVRGQPVQQRDFCVIATFPAGAYTFTVTPSIQGVTSGLQSTRTTGELLFEVTLGP